MANHNTYAVMFLVASIAIIGLPPLSGFAGKLMILEAAPVSASGFWLWGTMLAATLVMLIMMSRTGSKMIWHTLQGKPNDQSAPMGKRIAIGVLLSLSLVLTIFANPIRDYTDAVAEQLLDTQTYPNNIIPKRNGEGQYE